MVLEARKDAESVGYNYVGEEVKDASNVIDYNINEEQTKDAFAKLNANNDTTTGMANVIPGVNAPKLLAATSIIGGVGGSSSVSYSQISMKNSSTISANTWTTLDTYTFLQSSPDVRQDSDYPKRLYVKKGIYIIYIVINIGNSNGTFDGRIVRHDINGNGSYVLTYSGGGDYTSATVMYEAEDDGEYLTVLIKPSVNTSGSLTNNEIRFLKLA